MFHDSCLYQTQNFFSTSSLVICSHSSNFLNVCTKQFADRSGINCVSEEGRGELNFWSKTQYFESPGGRFSCCSRWRGVYSGTHSDFKRVFKKSKKIIVQLIHYYLYNVYTIMLTHHLRLCISIGQKISPFFVQCKLTNIDISLGIFPINAIWEQF